MNIGLKRLVRLTASIPFTRCLCYKPEYWFHLTSNVYHFLLIYIQNCNWSLTSKQYCQLSELYHASEKLRSFWIAENCWKNCCLHGNLILSPLTRFIELLMNNSTGPRRPTSMLAILIFSTYIDNCNKNTTHSNFATGLVHHATGFVCVFVKHKRKKSARNEKDYDREKKKEKVDLQM